MHPLIVYTCSALIQWMYFYFVVIFWLVWNRSCNIYRPISGQSITSHHIIWKPYCDRFFRLFIPHASQSELSYDSPYRPGRVKSAFSSSHWLIEDSVAHCIGCSERLTPAGAPALHLLLKLTRAVIKTGNPVSPKWHTATEKAKRGNKVCRVIWLDTVYVWRVRIVRRDCVQIFLRLFFCFCSSDPRHRD